MEPTPVPTVERRPGRPGQNVASRSLDPGLLVRNLGLAYLAGEAGSPRRPFTPSELASAVGLDPSTVRRALDSVRPFVAALAGEVETEEHRERRAMRNQLRRRRSTRRED